MSKAILTLVAILCTTASLNAQSFVKRYVGLSPGVGRSVMTASGDILVTGFRRTFTNPSNTYSIWASRLTVQGDTQWVRHIYSPLSQKAVDIKATPDGGCVLLGATGQTDLEWEAGLVVKLDSSGTIEWSRTYDSPIPDDAGMIELHPGGGYLVLLNSEGPQLLRLASNGDLLWTKGFLLDSISTVSKPILKAAENGDFLLVSRHNSNLIDGVIFTRLDSAANVIWSRNYLLNELILLDANETPDGGWILSGTQFEQIGTILKLDSLGGLEWINNYNETWNIRSVKPVAGAGYYAVGSYPIPGNRITDAEPFVAKLNNSGDLIWAKSYPEIFGTAFNEIYSLQDTSLVVMGSFRAFSVLGSRTVLMARTDSLGAIPCSVESRTLTYFSPINTPGNHTLPPNIQQYVVANYSLSDTAFGSIHTLCQPVSIQETPASSNELLVSPNPGRGIFRFESKASIRSISVYDAMGRQVMQQSASASSVHLDLTDQPQGVYYFRVATVSGTEEGKLLIW